MADVNVKNEITEGSSLCPNVSCKMIFHNKDQLEMHKRCHEVQISSDTSVHDSNSLTTKLPSFVTDQTTTPSNCLKHCDDGSLFYDIVLNPFDEEFRKASQLKTKLSIPENSIADSLETPKILPLGESFDADLPSSKDSNCLESNSTCLSDMNSICPDSKKIVTIQGPAIKKSESNLKMRLYLSDLSRADGCDPDGEASPKLISTPTPVIRAGPCASQHLVLTEIDAGADGSSDHYDASVTMADNSFMQNVPNPKISVVSPNKTDFCQFPVDSSVKCIDRLRANSPERELAPAQNIVNPFLSSSVFQMDLRLPNDAAIPVEIQGTSAGFTKVVAQRDFVQVSDSHMPSQIANNSGTYVTKMKLKQTLASSASAAKTRNSKLSRANTANRIAQMTRHRTPSETYFNEGDEAMIAKLAFTESSVAGEALIQIGQHASGSEVALDKRLKFLERNRVAAVRCREKKKQFVKNLFVKSDELEETNQKLQSEVCSLRTEVALLKSLLLQHKDCPVTMAMQGTHSEGDGFSKSFTTFKIQQPSGVITQITTTPVSHFTPQPDDILSNNMPQKEFEVQQSNVLVTPFKVRVATDAAKQKPVIIRSVISKPQEVKCSMAVPENLLIPNTTICLPPSVSSASNVTLLKYSNSVPPISASCIPLSGSNPTFIIAGSSELSNLGCSDVLTSSAPTAIPSQCVFSLDSSPRNISIDERKLPKEMK